MQTRWSRGTSVLVFLEDDRWYVMGVEFWKESVSQPYSTTPELILAFVQREQLEIEEHRPNKLVFWVGNIRMVYHMTKNKAVFYDWVNLDEHRS